MIVTVAICTWNRAKLLDRTLTQMHQLRIPADVEWELLIVNNNCTDETDPIIARHENALPIRRLFEPNPGLSNARNCAVDKAQGELILWTDDDVLVEPRWMASYIEASQRWPNAGFFGGPIEPWFEIEPPAWVVSNLKKLAGMLAIRDFGPVKRAFARKEAPFGANMGFRTKVLKQHSFDVRLGRVGHSLVGWEELDLLNRLKSLGHFGIWVGTARVKHYIPVNRLTLDYVRTWYEGHGQSAARVEDFSRCKLLWRALRYAWKRLWIAWLKSLLFSPGKGTPGWIHIPN